MLPPGPGRALSPGSSGGYQGGGRRWPEGRQGESGGPPTKKTGLCCAACTPRNGQGKGCRGLCYTWKPCVWPGICRSIMKSQGVGEGRSPELRELWGHPAWPAHPHSCSNAFVPCIHCITAHRSPVCGLTPLATITNDNNQGHPCI